MYRTEKRLSQFIISKTELMANSSTIPYNTTNKISITPMPQTGNLKGPSRFGLSLPYQLYIMSPTLLSIINAKLFCFWNSLRSLLP